MRTVRLLLIAGSLRAGSTNIALLRTMEALAPAGVTTLLYEGLGRLPHFNPDDDDGTGPLDPVVSELRSRIAGADAVVISTPEYAGALPGSFKNLLDWTIGGGETYGKPVAWVNVAGLAAPTGGADAHESLRKVLTYAGADIVDGACRRIPVPRGAVGDQGLITDTDIQNQVTAMLEALLNHLAPAADR